MIDKPKTIRFEQNTASIPSKESRHHFPAIDFILLIIVGLFLLLPTLSFSQNLEISEPGETAELSKGFKRLGLSMGILGVSPFIGPTVDYALSRRLTIEGGFGLPGPGAGIGLKLNEPIEAEENILHIGLEVTFIGGGGIGYLPVGISRYKDKGEYLSFDIGPALAEGSYIFWANFRVGKKF